MDSLYNQKKEILSKLSSLEATKCKQFESIDECVAEARAQKNRAKTAQHKKDKDGFLTVATPSRMRANTKPQKKKIDSLDAEIIGFKKKLSIVTRAIRAIRTEQKKSAEAERIKVDEAKRKKIAKAGLAEAYDIEAEAEFADPDEADACESDAELAETDEADVYRVKVYKTKIEFAKAELTGAYEEDAKMLCAKHRTCVSDSVNFWKTHTVALVD